MNKKQLTSEERCKVADELYKYKNPTTKMCTPNIAYELTDKWYYEWQNSSGNLDFFNWCILNKNDEQTN